MSRILELQDRLRDTNAAIAQIERAISDNPNSETLQLEASSLSKMQEALEDEFLAVTEQLGIDICSYRLIPKNYRIPVSAVSDVLNNFQKLFSAVYDSVKHGPKLISKLSQEIINESTLEFGYAFSGSLGIVLTVKRPPQLFEDNFINDSIIAFQNVVKVESMEQLKGFADKFGPSVIREIHKWASQHVYSDIDAEIQWKSGRTVKSAVLIQHTEFERIKDIIAQTSEESIQEIEVIGDLVGANIPHKNFQIKTKDGLDISGTFIDAISDVHTVELPRSYKSRIKESTTIKYSTGEKTVSYILLELKQLSK